MPDSVNRSFEVEEVTWEAASQSLYALRCEVFVDEQKVPREEELDADDPRSRHVMARAGDEVIGCGRLTPAGAIGRMAVRASWRGCGVGRAVLQKLLALARAEGRPELHLSSQLHALPFYARLGFVAEGPVYQECNIPHQRMRLCWADGSFQ